MILLVNSTDTSDAAERQSDKAWGFNPGSGGIKVCALKGRREADLPTFPAPLQGAKINNNSDPGLETPGFITLPLCGIEVSAPETVEFTNSIMNCRAVFCRPDGTLYAFLFNRI
ncbi:MAG: hypothetical protein GY749_08580 [Desulfobacteraceae bacterium]|nr:hypothetical protein [Desulfobacteraceae bacterium]